MPTWLSYLTKDVWLLCLLVYLSIGVLVAIMHFFYIKNQNHPVELWFKKKLGFLGKFLFLISVFLLDIVFWPWHIMGILIQLSYV